MKKLFEKLTVYSVKFNSEEKKIITEAIEKFLAVMAALAIVFVIVTLIFG